MYAVGTSIWPNYYLPISSTFCNGGTFKINSQTGSGCANMFLAMDPTSPMLTANYPYPNLQCNVFFICDSDSSISSPAVVATSNS